MLYLGLIFFNFLFVFFFNFFEKKINIYDFPNGINKIHNKKISLLGGVIFFWNLLIFLIYSSLFSSYDNLSIFGFTTDLSFTVFIISSLTIFCLGILDDKINLSVRLRLLFLVTIVVLNLFFNEMLLIKQVRLSFTDSFFIGNFSYLWTLICFLLLINAFNFFDGLNIQSSGLVFAICFFFLFNNFFIEIILVILIANTFFLYLNYNSKTFLGNSGSFFLPFFLGSLLISSYNNYSQINADQIVILLLVPGLDLFRLFFFRLLNKKNPFKGDKEHIHHYLIKKFSKINSALIVQLLIWIPLLISEIWNNFFIAFMTQILFYIFIITKYRN